MRKTVIFVSFLMIFISLAANAQPPCAANPLAADYCANATPICNLNGYCGNTSPTYTNTVSATNLSNETNTPLGAVFCATIQNNSWLKFIADSTAAIFNVWVSNCQNNRGIQMQIYSTTDCYNFTAVSNCWNPMVPTNGTITAVGLVPGNAYYFMIDGTNGDVCDYVIATNTGVTTIPTVSADQSVCGGTPVSITGTGGISYEWSSVPNDPGLASQAANATIIVTPSVTTAYTVTVTNPGMNTFCPSVNNILTSTVTVTSISATISNVVPASCGQNNGAATAVATGGSGVYSYTWNTMPTQLTATASNLSAGTYIVAVTNGNCQSSDTVTIMSLPMPVATISNVINTLCSQSDGGATITINGGSPPFVYQWNTTPPQTTANLQQVPAGIYTVTVTDNTNCVVTGTVTITDSPGPQVSITYVVPADCGLTGGVVTSSITGGTPPLIIHWSTNPPQTTLVASDLHTGIYDVTVTDQNGCTAITSASVGYIAAPVISTGCVPEHCRNMDGAATVISGGGSGHYTYFWNTGDTTRSISDLHRGTYTVTVDDGYCTANATVVVPGTPVPLAGFTVYPNSLTIDDGPVLFSDYSTGNIIDWNWILGDGSGNDIPSFYHKYQDTGIYIVTLIITDSAGCSDTATDMVHVRDIFTFYIPNAFTPNGDGMNEFFTPYGINVDPSYFEMSIFNRWDNLVYHTNRWLGTHAEPWNGTMNNSGGPGEAPSDSYTYKIILKDLSGLKHLYAGKVMLIN
jgi:gliding motility-associated-like protein